MPGAHFDEPPGRRSGPGPVVLMLSPELEVRAQTPETDRYLRALVPPTTSAGPIPAGAYNVAAQLLAVEAGVDDHPPLARVHLAGRRVADPAGGPDGDAAARPDIAVTIERDHAGGAHSTLFARACGLSAREAELLGHLAAGADTRARRRAHVPVRAHGPGPPEVDLRQDRHPQPPDA